MVRIYNPKEKIQGYTIEELITTGNNSVSYAARSSAGDKVFFKLYQSPSIRVPWYKPFVEHQKELKRRIEEGPCRQFCYRFLGGFEHDRKFHQVFEFLDRSHSLAQILDRIRISPSAVSWDQRELMAKVLVAGIKQLHQAKIVHADLKPDNVMLIEDPSIGMKYRLKIIDMDFSFFTDRKAPWDKHEGYFGTPGYLSPEHVTGKVPLPTSDVFTLGLMLYQLLAQGHPYVFDDAEKYLPAYQAHAAPRPKLMGVPRPPASAATIGDVLYRCLHPDPTRRPTAADLHRALTGDSGSGAVPLDDARRKRDDEDARRRRDEEEAERKRKEVERLKEEGRRRDEEEKAKKEAAAPAPVRLVLVGPGGTELSVGARLTLGRTVLAKFGDGAKYAADQQFVVEPVDGDWFALACPGTPNDTMFNGALLTGRVKLAAGDRIAVGNAAKKKTALELTVRAG
jgi:eukaryotic-like serine/threonine-protein kinase